MRETKFRAWNKDAKIMYSWEELIGAKGHAIFTWIAAQYKNKSKYNFLDEYSGLKINGNEIYEGDILECENLETKEREILAVKNSPGQFSLYDPNCCERCKSGDGCVTYLSDWVYFPDLWRIKIIGNIHENPELLGA